MIFSDGVLTPAQSVLGAVQGLSVVKPDIEKSTIVGTTCGILILLFLVQPFGTTKLASTFAPIVIICKYIKAGNLLLDFQIHHKDASSGLLVPLYASSEDYAISSAW